MENVITPHVKAVVSASPGVDVSTQLFNAIYTGDVSSTENLLQQGLHIDGELSRSSGSETVRYVPLQEAAACEDDRMVRLLVRYGADVNRKSAKGITALHDAALCGNYAAVKFLLHAHADVEARDDEGRTPLHEAVEHGHVAVAQHLIDHHASINCLSKDGIRPLDLALDNHYFDVAQLLLEHDAVCNTKRLGYKTACELAAWTGNNGMRRLLEGKGSMNFAHRRAKVCEEALAPLSKGMRHWPGRDTSPRFCKACNEFRLRCPSTWQKQYVQDTFSEDTATYTHMHFQCVIKSAASGCPLCRMILDALQINLNNDVHLRYLTASLRGLQEPTTQVWSDFLDMIEVVCGNKVGYIRIASVPDEWAAQLGRSEAFDDSITGSDASLFSIAGWLSICLSRHPKCNQYQRTPPMLPSRVIDVGPPDGSKEPFLYCSQGRKDYYVTLSHRWSDYDLIKTTTATLEKQMTEIPLRTLPKTMQDAVFITRKLGTRFLWIDAICIIQDDELDWEREAMNMAKIYKSSLLTIAGTEPKDHKKGLFAKRDRFRTRPCKLDLRLSRRHKNMFRHSGPLFAFADRSKNSGLFRPKGELDSRAWVLQEQLLSSRVLSCAGGELFWDCVSMNASETHPNGFPTLAYGINGQATAFTKFKEAVVAKALGKHLPTRENIYATWRQIAVDYSQRDITVERDRVMAMAGITRQIGTSLEDTNSFGLWQKHLLTENLWKELLWRVDPKAPRVISKQEGIPSWSWLSVMRPITYDAVDLRVDSGIISQAKIVDIHSKGEIEIEGPMATTHRVGLFESSLTEELERFCYDPIRRQRKFLLRHRRALSIKLKPTDIIDSMCPDSKFPRDNMAVEFSADCFQDLILLNEDIRFMEIARVNHHQLCLCLRHTAAGGQKFRRIGICCWNMAVYPNLNYSRSRIRII